MSTPAGPPADRTPRARATRGRRARKRVPRSAHGMWIPAVGRPDPVAVLERQGADRVPELLPVRYGRMVLSPFAFLRGSAAIMAADLAATDNTGLTVQLCGDAHLMNFGLYASPERIQLFDVNDFDETFPGPFEWDVKRLAVSAAVAARDNGLGKGPAHRAARESVTRYRLMIRKLADLGELDVWYTHIDAAGIVRLIRPGSRGQARATFARARRRTSLQALGKLTEVVDGRRRIVDDPPLVERVGGPDLTELRKAFSDYRSTLTEERRALLDRYRFVDAARKVVGVGSVGTRCFIVLLTGRDDGDPLFLQIKEAAPSVLEEHLPNGVYDHPGRRVVAGQRLTQAASDIFLGWMTGSHGRAYYWRQLRDMKGSVDLAALSAGQLVRYAGLCGVALARSHARSGDRIALAAYLGAGDTFDRAVADFALRYATQNAADHSALEASIAAGVIAAEPGV
ncbi:DUF2252 domain-containing protein [Streptomyces sp. NPDC127068]|uniref:DUF2252 domain-containing protein n=1 Tax=Streptomyces sp. NPDC127068 TaxID=3347127 RepID=UPI00365B38F9